MRSEQEYSRFSPCDTSFWQGAAPHCQPASHSAPDQCPSSHHNNFDAAQAIQELLLAHSDLAHLPASDDNLQLASCLYALGNLLFRVGRFEEAELALLQWLSIVQPQEGPTATSTILARTRQEGTSPDVKGKFVEVRTLLGSMKLQAGLLKEAEVDLWMAAATASEAGLRASNTALLLADALLQQQRPGVRILALSACCSCKRRPDVLSSATSSVLLVLWCHVKSCVQEAARCLDGMLESAHLDAVSRTRALVLRTRILFDARNWSACLQCAQRVAATGCPVSLRAEAMLLASECADLLGERATARDLVTQSAQVRLCTLRLRQRSNRAALVAKMMRFCAFADLHCVQTVLSAPIHVPSKTGCTLRCCFAAAWLALDECTCKQVQHTTSACTGLH